jgi:hypothetical protein
MYLILWRDSYFLTVIPNIFFFTCMHIVKTSDLVEQTTKRKTPGHTSVHHEDICTYPTTLFLPNSTLSFEFYSLCSPWELIEHGSESCLELLPLKNNNYNSQPLKHSISKYAPVPSSCSIIKCNLAHACMDYASSRRSRLILLRPAAN